LIDKWSRGYNQVRPHSSLGYRPPAPEVKWAYRGDFMNIQGAGHGIYRAYLNYVVRIFPALE